MTVGYAMNDWLLLEAIDLRRGSVPRDGTPYLLRDAHSQEPGPPGSRAPACYRQLIDLRSASAALAIGRLEMLCVDDPTLLAGRAGYTASRRRVRWGA